MNVEPLYDRLLIKRIETDAITKGGILIPDSAQEKPQQGRVIATGRGHVLDDGHVRRLEVALGDRILFDRHSGTELQIDGLEHLIIREDDVLAVLK